MDYLYICEINYFDEESSDVADSSSTCTFYGKSVKIAKAKALDYLYINYFDEEDEEDDNISHYKCLKDFKERERYKLNGFYYNVSKLNLKKMLSEELGDVVRCKFKCALNDNGDEIDSDESDCESE
jgi:hypothetical protein